MSERRREGGGGGGGGGGGSLKGGNMIPRSTVEGGGATRGMCICYRDIYFMAPQTITVSMYMLLW